jgi:hypothetical protein
MIESIGTALLIILGLASTLALRLGWLGTDSGHRRASLSAIVEHGDLIASDEPPRHGRNE